METTNKQRGNNGNGFKEGISGNMKGRPLKGYSITEAFKTMLASSPETKANIVAAIHEKALSGDTTAQKLIWNYLDGMPKQSIEQTGEVRIVISHD